MPDPRGFGRSPLRVATSNRRAYGIELPAPGVAGIAAVYRTTTSFQLYLDQIDNRSL